MDVKSGLSESGLIRTLIEGFAMFFPTSLSYALQALVRLPEDGTRVAVHDLAELADVPGPFLAKVMQTLARSGIVEGTRGPHGGYRMAMADHQITIATVSDALGEGLGLPACILENRPCNDPGPCLMHNVWLTLRPQLEACLYGLSIRDIRMMNDPNWVDSLPHLVLQKVQPSEAPAVS